MLSFSKGTPLDTNPHNPTECHLSLAYRHLTLPLPLSSLILAPLQKQTTVVLKQIIQERDAIYKEILKQQRILEKEQRRRMKRRNGAASGANAGPGLFGRIGSWFSGSSSPTEKSNQSTRSQNDSADSPSADVPIPPHLQKLMKRYKTLQQYEEILSNKGLQLTVLDLSNNDLGLSASASTNSPSSHGRDPSLGTSFAQKLNLEPFSESLHTLILDSNQLTHHFKLPAKCHSLKSLSLNNNNIKYLSKLMDRLVVTCPQLTELSLLKNPCCLNYFIGKQLNDEKRYRMYVIGRLTQLKVLDGCTVTQQEREDAREVFGKWRESLHAGVISKTDVERTRSVSSRATPSTTSSGPSADQKQRVLRQERVRNSDSESASQKRSRNSSPVSNSPSQQHQSLDSPRTESTNDISIDALDDTMTASTIGAIHGGAADDVEWSSDDEEDEDTNQDSPIPNQKQHKQFRIPLVAMMHQERKQEKNEDTSSSGFSDDEEKGNTSSSNPQQSSSPNTNTSSSVSSKPRFSPATMAGGTAFQLPKIDPSPSSDKSQKAPLPPNPQANALQTLIQKNLRLGERRGAADDSSSSSGSDDDNQDSW